MTTTTAPDWIRPGAQIVVWRDTFNPASADYRIATVKTVAAKSFTVDTMTERFQIDDLATKRQGSSYTGWRYRAVPVGSDKHNELRDLARRQKLDARARAAVEAWRLNRDDPALIEAVIEAMTALRDSQRAT